MAESWQVVMRVHHRILLWNRKLMSSSEYKVNCFLSCVSVCTYLCLDRKWI